MPCSLRQAGMHMNAQTGETALEQQAIVMEVFGDKARVRGSRASACGHCAGQAACGTLGSWAQRFADMDVHNGVGARVGDTVTVRIADGVLLKSTAVLYGLPMLAFVIGGIMAQLLAQAVAVHGELWSVTGALLGLALTYLWMVKRQPLQHLGTGEIIRVQQRQVIPVYPV